MATLKIDDRVIAERLAAIARREGRSIEAVLASMIERYPQPPLSVTIDRRETQHKLYVLARDYWRAAGDPRAELTDDALDQQFGGFDEQGIPLLRDERLSEPPVGSMAYLATQIATHGGIATSDAFDPAQADDILNAEFADYLLKRDHASG